MCNKKVCFRCKVEKDLTDFYKHPRMADGHVNKCKDCNRADVIENRRSRIDYYREYDRARGSRQSNEYLKGYRDRFANKCRAHRMVGYAISSGKLFSEPCEVCGAVGMVHAHHDDYAKPLNVRWLCAAHHKEWHTKNGEGKNST